MLRLCDASIEKELDSILHYVAIRLDKSGHNSKPVLLHSFKVAMIVYRLGYDRDIVLAGALHDLLEDTDTSKNELENKFGHQIADIVEAVSFDATIEDEFGRAQELFDRCVAYGREALLVKCADLLDNVNFVYLAPISRQSGLLAKYSLFLDTSKHEIGNEMLYQSLSERVAELGESFLQ